jgi:hypothetical protein
MLQAQNGKTSTATSTIALEDFKVELATWWPVRHRQGCAPKASTDMFFIEAAVREELPATAAVGGGGGDDDEQQNQISQRQKEIIAPPEPGEGQRRHGTGGECRVSGASAMKARPGEEPGRAHEGGNSPRRAIRSRAS